MSIRIVKWESLSEGMQHECLQRPVMRQDEKLRQSVDSIIAEVRERDDAALFELTRRLDKAALTELRVGTAEFENAERSLSAAQIDAIDLAIRNVRAFHEAQRPHPVDVETMPGVRCERINQPIDNVGLYVPAGTAPLPSAAVMLAVPAAIAGCPHKLMCTPPRGDGTADPAVLVAARRAGVDTIFKIGGAQAIAAMAYGTASVPRVSKIFGPGNAWVTEAKSQVAGDPAGAAIDMPAGPSEALVIADENASPEFVASDLLSQAEHGRDSQVLLVTTNMEIAERVRDEVGAQLEGLSRADIAKGAIDNSLAIVTASLDSAVEISNRYAPEHLIIQTTQPRRLLANVRNAGSVFLGCWSPESVGDYCSGTNHVLPTYGYARSYSGLSVDQFMRQMTVQELSADGLRRVGAAVIELAGLEGLDAHSAAVTRRLAVIEANE
jgi:histidinol dehydrogenase